MSFEAVLGNKEFEFVVSEVTLTVVTWHCQLSFKVKNKNVMMLIICK
jgi:hypothetical protein